MVGLRLFLPETWTCDEARLERAGVPAEYRSPRTKSEIALAELDRRMQRAPGGIRKATAAHLPIESLRAGCTLAPTGRADFGLIVLGRWSRVVHEHLLRRGLGLVAPIGLALANRCLRDIFFIRRGSSPSRLLGHGRQPMLPGWRCRYAQPTTTWDRMWDRMTSRSDSPSICWTKRGLLGACWGLLGACWRQRTGDYGGRRIRRRSIGAAATTAR